MPTKLYTISFEGTQEEEEYQDFLDFCSQITWYVKEDYYTLDRVDMGGNWIEARLIKIAWGEIS